MAASAANYGCFASLVIREDQGALSSLNAVEMDTHTWDENVEDEEEPTPLEYARLCGVCKDFLLDDPIKTCASSIPTFDTEDAFDDLKCTTLPFADDLTHERIEIVKDALLVLQRTMFPSDDYHTLAKLIDAPWKQRLKMDVPLLSTDHEMDMRSFGQAVEPSYSQLKLPVEYVDIEKDEGLNWPEKYRRLSETWTRDIETDKLEFPRDLLRYLQDLILDNADDRELDTFFEQVKARSRLKGIDPITPPLMPITSPPLEPFDPSSETGQLPLLSDIEDSVAAEAEALDYKFHRNDGILPPNLTSSDLPDFKNSNDLAKLYTPLQSDLQSEASLRAHKRKRDTLTVEEPLFPSDTSSSISGKTKKSVNFTTQLHSLIPDLPPSLPVGQLDPESEASFEAFFNDVIEPLAQEATQAMLQEQLQAADSLQRVEVPVMDFSLLHAPWRKSTRSCSTYIDSSESQQDEWRAFSAKIKMCFTQLHDYGLWKVTGKAERQLQPYPFRAELGKMPDETGIEDSRYIAVIMSDMSLGDVVTSSELIWKPEGLRILNRKTNEYTEDELEPSLHDNDEIEYDGGVDNLVRKRRREFHAAELNDGIRSSSLAVYSPARNRDNQQIAPQAQMTLPVPPGAVNTELSNTNHFFGHQFTTTGGLSNFMKSMGAQSKRPRLDENANADLLALTHTPAVIIQPAASTGAGPLAAKDITRQHSTAVPFQVPKFPSQSPPRYIILSLDVVQNHRQILRRVFKELCPNAGHIERDFSNVQDAPEADILLSPGAGLIFTSLQQTKQRPLPGQASQLTNIKTRILRLAVRYELLVVLVGETMSLDTETLDQHDCEAMADFAAFCSNCNTEVQVCYVPSGIDSLAAWVTASIFQYGDIGRDVLLLQDETLWEQTLRRCGLNAYAAQVILASLKPEDLSPNLCPLPNVESSQAKDAYGIETFLCMNPEQRIAKFEALLGGRRVLQLVNQVLNQQWLSAKNGFRKSS